MQVGWRNRAATCWDDSAKSFNILVVQLIEADGLVGFAHDIPGGSHGCCNTQGCQIRFCRSHQAGVGPLCVQTRNYRSLAMRMLGAITSGPMVHALEEVDERAKLMVREILAQARKALHKRVLLRSRCGC